MKLSISGLLTACLVLAVAGAVAKVIALLIILALLAAIITRPREMVALATTMGILNLIALYPLPALGIAGGLLAYRVLSLKRAPFWQRGCADRSPTRIRDGSRRQ